MIHRTVLLGCFALLCGAEEGMWLVNQFPKAAIQKTYGFTVTDSFLEHIQLSSVRFNSGGSGSFVSPRGLLFTNHHVGRDCIQKLSSAQHDYIKNGFYAATEAEEKQCPDLELNLLTRIEDVTQKVKGAEKTGMTTAEIGQARRESMSRIEKECATATGNRCDVVTLYSGGRYDLYQYQKYTDVRLVFAPEEAIAAFGGDPDNFTYPRYCLDFAFFRAYEKGKPVQPRHYFRWSRAGAREGELSFVPGNPGSTGRLMTVAQLEFSRDHSYPLRLRQLESLIQALEAFGTRGEENRRQAGDYLLTAQNSFKAFTGFMRGLRDPRLIGRRRDDEQTLRASVAADPEKQKTYGGTWDQVAAAYAEYRDFYKPYALSSIGSSDLFDVARDVLRYPEELAKPSERRLREFRDSNLPSLEQAMYSPAPLYDPLEIAVIAEDLRFMLRELGADDPVVKQVLDGKSPDQAAEFYVKTSKLKDVAERKRLAASREAVRQSDDGMLRLARILEERNRTLRKRVEDRVDAVLNTSAAKIAQVKFAAGGANNYPDATFTFRIAFGPVSGYMVDGKKIPWATTLAGLYQRATGVEPFRCPESWLKAKSKLNLSTPFNFVTTADTHGGNSGSPTVNTKGEITGILFDGNIEGLPNRFVYDDVTARSVHVAGQGIVEALRKVYGAGKLVEELGVK
ncbi:MAG: S46 family peptidase [Acidobacteria bacterium]|nr:S46 family peptidase [Acidobacteriota bacterium]